MFRYQTNVFRVTIIFGIRTSEGSSCQTLFRRAPLKSHWLRSYGSKPYFLLGVAGLSPWRLTALTILQTSSSQASHSQLSHIPLLEDFRTGWSPASMKPLGKHFVVTCSHLIAIFIDLNWCYF